jgi:aspartyl aminopeptidase
MAAKKKVINKKHSITKVIGAEKRKKRKSKYEFLFYKQETAWKHIDEKKAFVFSEGYKKFLNIAKTEREAVVEIEKIAKVKGYKNFETIKTLTAKDKIYYKTNKNIVLVNLGKFTNIKVIASHLDSPRLDLKPKPVFEDSDLALLKTHYYGGIKKYQWVNRPLAIHGFALLKDGTKKKILIGESDKDPVFVIPDLLPHLAKEQYEKKVDKFISGEDLNVIIGNLPLKDKEIKEHVKLRALKYLHDTYGITEKDFVSAEIEIVPAEKARDVGFDKSMIGAYGQDDRVCVYTSLNALSSCKNKETAIAYFVDKEEIGSEGKSGAKSKFLFNFLNELIAKLKLKTDAYKVLKNAEFISADVTSALNPNFKNAQEPSNVSLLGRGVSIEKYGGGGGKYSTNDTDTEYIHKLVTLFDKNKVMWQTGENGKIDLGGGGTVAMYFAEYGCDIIDLGPPVLGMHSPFEISSKADVYSAFLAYKVFYEN